MKKINTRKLYYLLSHRYFTLNNAVILAGLIIAVGWAWGSVEVMERNYNLQKQVATKLREQRLLELETTKLKFEKRYYESTEYQELAVRERLGLAKKGEAVLVLPPNTPQAKLMDEAIDRRQSVALVEPSNVQQWVTFIFGGNSQSL